ncbi:MAG TPA: diaminopimelate decarboxylase [bacterium]|nr:diaminopimelate decarboxylase [bacterium]
MIPYSYRDNRLFCEDTDLAKVASHYGTPAYVYSKAGITGNYTRIDAAFAGASHLVCYALKANANPVLLKLMAELGAGADVVSGGELAQALAAGFPAQRIVFASVGKTDAEIRFAIRSGILALNVESREELEVTARLAAEMGMTAPIALRINPDIDIEGHPYLTTGKSANKFGIALDEARAAYLWAAEQKSLKIVGVHCHIGSMIKKSDPYHRMAETLAAFVVDLGGEGIRFEHVDLGGGLGVDYTRVLDYQGSPWYMEPEEMAAQVIPVLQPLGCEILLEPGRSIVGPNGVLLSQVLYRKETKGKKFLVVDAAMSDLIRPSLYGAYHAVLPLQAGGSEVETVDVVGAICESGDFLAKDRELERMERGNYLAVMTAGAYGYTLTSNYNARPRPVEVLIDGSRHMVIRDREPSLF